MGALTGLLLAVLWTAILRVEPDHAMPAIWLLGAAVTLLTGGLAAVAWRRFPAAAANPATAARSRFVALVSHEIRTPLNAVLSALALLADSDLQPAQRRLADRARQAGDALVHLLNDILEMSRMEGGRLSLRPSVFALRPLLEGLLDMVRAAADERGITLVLEIAPAVPDQLLTDPGRLRQVLLNLLSNAIDHTAPGTVRLVAARVVCDGLPTLRLAVRDEGPRIAPADGARLFEPFVRLESGTGSGAAGTGLGLAICQLLVTLMGGRIGLGTAGSGNEFWVVLPIDAAAAQLPAPAARARQPASPPPRRRPPRTRILLVEDVPANRTITATMLRQAGHLADVAPSGRDAIIMVQRTPYDLVLMDVVMPGMTGLEAVRRIRRLSGAAARVPIVAVTAHASPEDRAACLGAGMNEMLTKSVGTDLLEDALIRHVWQAPAPPAVPQQRLDIDRIIDLRDSLPDAAFRALLEQCLSDLQSRIAVLRRALDDGAAPLAAETAHALLGLCGGYGLVGLCRRLDPVAQSARSGNLSAAVASASGLEAEFVETAAALRALHRQQAA